ncbi:Dyp-type peroxidase [Solimicrobium silvestre]|uniref:Dyp-type peroxidase family n=1 Tax=Solimicrobium silvestre TaxID=2099400 RepID=A0A2S9GXW1_9BURK|nr:Dyp-type peroxidase [Solimicrobium silvestre]PRC92553.1 Dyp-type peroxidase family [Solimicrobium silvestre]
MSTNLPTTQAGIMQTIPAHANFLIFNLKTDGKSQVDYVAALQKLAPLVDGDKVVLGIGLSLVTALKKQVSDLRDFPVFPDAKVALPVNKAAVWCWLRESERGALVKQSQRVVAALSGAFELVSCVDAFKFGAVQDLTGYEDGTENPQAQAAIDAAIVQQRGAGQDGASFVAVQQWLHHWNKFDAMSTDEQDNIIGRRISDNEELDDAPESAHVKRTAQESFDPEAFVLRRSMPWSLGTQSGFYFVAFGRTLDAFEAQLKRMSGAEDGIVDGLFRFSQPQTGGYFWCPPMLAGKVDLSLVLD